MAHASPPVDLAKLDMLVTEARDQLGTSCYVIDETGKEYGPSPIEWEPHWDFGHGLPWCEARVHFDGAPVGVYIGYRTISDAGSIKTMDTFFHPVRIMRGTDSLTVNLHT